MRWAFSASGNLLRRAIHAPAQDLKAGIWMRAVRRAIQFIAHRSQISSASYSQAGRRASSSSFSSSFSIFSRIFEDDDENEDDLMHPYFTLRFVFKAGYSAHQHQ
jgi:hypothetical protein